MSGVRSTNERERPGRTFYCTDEEYKRMKDEAWAARMSVSAFIVMKALGEKPRKKAEKK